MQPHLLCLLTIWPPFTFPWTFSPNVFTKRIQKEHQQTATSKDTVLVWIETVFSPAKYHLKIMLCFQVSGAFLAGWVNLQANEYPGTMVKDRHTDLQLSVQYMVSLGIQNMKALVGMSCLWTILDMRLLLKVPINAEGLIRGTHSQSTIYVSYTSCEFIPRCNSRSWLLP